jgi:glycerol-3-phosphate acyltransferase PlsY
MTTLIYGVLFTAASYLLGSLPQMHLIARARGIDPEQEPDLHAALWRKAGRGIGFCAIFIDVLKGVIPVIVGFLLGLPLAIVLAGTVAATCGQMWPAFEKFDGEKGNTPGIGATLTLTSYLTATSAPQAYIALLAFVVPILTAVAIKLSRQFTAPGQTWNQRLMFTDPAGNSMPIGNLIAFAATPIASACIKLPLEVTIGLAAIFVVIVIRRLTAGLSADLKTATISPGKMLLNRFLYDRSYR